MNRAILDLETSGFSITKNAIVEIGIVVINKNYEVINSHSKIIKPYTRPDSIELVSYKDDAMAVHGITMNEINSGYDVIEVLEHLKSILVEYEVTTLIGHNIKTFDLPRLDYLFKRFTEHELNYIILDTLEEARNKGLNLESYSLDALCKHYGIINNDSHRALGDCFATLELLKKFGG